MPLLPYQPVDTANLASKLPEPLRKPGGMAMSALMTLMGGDDPAGQAMQTVGPLGMVSDTINPTGAIRELLNLIKDYKGRDPLQVLAGEKATGLLPPPTKVNLPEGFEIPTGFNPPNIERAPNNVMRYDRQEGVLGPIKAERNPFTGPRRMGGSTRIPEGLERGISAANLRTYEAPSIKSLEDLGSLKAGPPSGGIRKPTIREQRLASGLDVEGNRKPTR